MSKQWSIVLVITGGLVSGVLWLAHIGSKIEPVAVGRTAPDFQVVNLFTGDSVSLRKHYAGNVTLVNVWATWCPPCQAEMPAMQRAYASLAPAGFKIAAVSVDDNTEDVLAFAGELKLNFDILHDRSKHIQQLYQIPLLPESFLLNRHGVIVKRASGAYDWNSPASRALIKLLLDEPMQ